MSDPTEDRPSPVAVVGEEVVVRLSGRFRSLSAANALALEQLLAPLVGAPGARRLTLDCDDVTFLGAAALGTFVRLQRQARARGGRLRLRNVHDPLYEVFEVTHLVGLLNVRRAAGDDGLEPDGGEWVAEGSLHSRG